MAGLYGIAPQNPNNQKFRPSNNVRAYFNHIPKRLMNLISKFRKMWICLVAVDHIRKRFLSSVPDFMYLIPRTDSFRSVLYSNLFIGDEKGHVPVTDMETEERRLNLMLFRRLSLESQTMNVSVHDHACF